MTGGPYLPAVGKCGIAVTAAPPAAGAPAAAGAGITIIPCGEEAEALERLPLTVMALEVAQAEMLVPGECARLDSWRLCR